MTRAPRRVSTALMPMVVPTTTCSTSAASNDALSRAAATALTGLAGFDGTFATHVRPDAASDATRSVNVPPVSIPTLIPMPPSGARFGPAARRPQARVWSPRRGGAIVRSENAPATSLVLHGPPARRA